MDEDGNVFTALTDYANNYGLGSPKLRLSKWSAQTRQIEWTHLVEQTAYAVGSTRLDLQADGGLLTWTARDTPSYAASLNFVQLSKDGLIQGQRQVGPIVGDEARSVYGNDLQTRTAAGKTYAMWSRFDCLVDLVCQTVAFQFSTFLPGQGWSTTQSIPAQARSVYNSTLPFEVNPSGVAALVMPDWKTPVYPDFRYRVDIRVMALD